MIKKINTAEPFFFKKDIDYILKKFKHILEGRDKLSMGKYTNLFEKSFANYNKSKYCLATSSGTSSLEIILKSMNINNNDEVIVPSHTFIATASAVMNVGAIPIFCDIDENFLLDFNKLDKMINRKTKAVIIVHFGGLIHQEIFKIKKYLSNKNIFLIEDSSHAHGATINDLKAGNLSDASAFSLYSSKIITTGEGGLITTNNKKIYLKCSSIRSRGLNVTSNKEIYSELGSNYRFTEIQALLGLMQLKNIDKFINHRLKIANIYKDILTHAIKEKKIRIIKESKNILNPRWKYTVFLLNNQSREKIKKNMKKKMISIDWAYDPLVHLQPVMLKYFYNKSGMLSFSEKLAKTHINLPIHYGISIKQAKFIATIFLKNI